MYIGAELVVTYYQPRVIEKGMLFARVIDDSHWEIYEMNHSPINHEEVVKNNGFPVELFLIDDNGDPIAHPHEIAWVEDDDGEFHAITLEEINEIFRNNGECTVKVNRKLYKEELIVPVYHQEKVIIKLIDL